MPPKRGSKAAALTMTLLLAGAALLLPLAAGQAPAPVVVLFSELPEGLVEGSGWEGGTVLRVDEALRFAVVQPAAARTMQDLASMQGVLGVDADEVTQWIETTGDDPLLAEQYGPQQVRAPEAWTSSRGSLESSVCLVDTGLRHTHEEFQDGRYLGGRDFVNRDDDPMDDQGHGTHVAGIAAAARGNDKGIAGIGAVGIYVAKVMDEKGRGSPSTIASGIRWCVDQGADVVSLSLGGKASSVLHAAVRYASEKGALVVAAAGNEGCKECVSYPAAYPEALAVTCTTPERALCSFSSTGPETDLAAPGAKILSTWLEGDASYKPLSGTSMSTPHVAGVAALVWSQAPDLTNVELARILKETAQDIGADGQDNDFGAGLVDARAALDAALGNGTAPAPGEKNATPAPEREAPTQPAPPAKGNRAPVADAGPNLTVQASRGFDAALVPLDGSASGDADGKLAAAQWREDGRLLGTGLEPRVILRAGTHVLTLTVRDDKGATATDTVTIIVLPAKRAEG